MITFRYHVVTLVAVFMSIGLGVLFGATFIDQNIVEGLESAQLRLGSRNETLRERVIELEAQGEAMTAFANSTRDLIVREALTDLPVLLLTLESTPEDLVEAVTQTLGVAGAQIAGNLVLTDQLSLTEDDALSRLSESLGSTSSSAGTLSRELIAGLVGDLKGEGSGLSQKLIEAGLARGQINQPVTPDGEAALVAPESIPAPPLTAVMLLAGQTPTEMNEQLIFPLIRALAEGQVPTAVGEASLAERLLRPLRDEAVSVVTVDGAETAVGQAALVLGLRAALNGQTGSYGSGEGASTALPAP